MNTDANEPEVLRSACAQIGVKSRNATVIRLGENAIYRLPGGIVARIARPGQIAAATREVQIARWLARSGVPATQALDVTQPVAVDGRAVTFWQELPPHRHGTPPEIATALRRLHQLDVPTDVDLGRLAPFVRVAERIDSARTLPDSDRTWLRAHLAELENRYQEHPLTRPPCVVHGDAWAGNVVATADGTVVLLDLERSSIGPPEWDLVSTAIKRTSFASISPDDYRAFCDHYGHDVTAWDGYTLFRDIRELRMCTYLAQLAVDHPHARPEADHRLRCLRGEHGPRPWHWTPL